MLCNVGARETWTSYGRWADQIHQRSAFGVCKRAKPNGSSATELSVFYPSSPQLCSEFLVRTLLHLLLTETELLLLRNNPRTDTFANNVPYRSDSKVLAARLSCTNHDAPKIEISIPRSAKA